MTLRLRIAWAVLAAGVSTASHAQAQTIAGHVVAGGGGESSGGSYVLTGTAGQAEATPPIAGASYSLTSGFWSFEETCTAIALTPTLLPPGAPGTAYPETTIAQSGGLGAVIVTITSGALPTGMTVSSTGVISGTPSLPGDFDFTVTARDVIGCAGARSYTLSIALPAMALSVAQVNFGVVVTLGAPAIPTPPQLVSLTQSGPGTVAWTAAANVPWITVSPAAGAGPATLTVALNADVTTLPPSGAGAGTLTVTTTGALNAPATTVNVTVVNAADGAAPFGAFDTPDDGQAGVTGSIAVTGWALDDVGVTRVRLFRNPVAGEPAGQQVFIGSAVLVSDARPDIAALHPLKPYSDRAGWGYLMLTNFLPDQGNGTFTLYAYADDVDGHSTLLGSKTIVCTNASATAPFGAIDTPEQGATVSGSAYVNFGWVLTPNPKTMPLDGSTIRVFIDSVPGATVTYNFPRADIQALFPGYANTDGAVGFRTLDTTQLANGVHTIAWIVTDNQGAAAGIGSRYFTVSNRSSALHLENAEAPVAARTVGVPRAVVGEMSALDAIEVSAETVSVMRDVDPAAALPDLAHADAAGIRHVRAVQLERLAIALGGAAPAGGEYRGYTIDGTRLKPLPVGSHLAARTGEFAWAPGLGFGGTHRLVFVRRGADGREQQIRIDVTVLPR